MDMVAGIPEEQDFRSFLQDELEKRCKKNPRFSLRAFARTLEVEPSALSKILHGKRALTPKMLMRMANQLGLQERDIERFAVRQGGSRGSTSVKTAYLDNNNRSTILHQKEVKLILSNESLKKAEQLLEKFLEDLSNLAATSQQLDQKELYSIEVFLRSETVNPKIL